MCSFLSKLTISTRLALIIVGAQAVLYCVFAFLILGSSTKAVEASEHETFRLLADTIRWSIEDEISSAALSIVSAAQDERVHASFAARDRNGLYAYLSPLYERIREKVVRFHFHLPDGISFLRMHDPDSFGDSLLEIRPMIKAALQLRQTISGIEQGRDGLGLRVVTPVVSKGLYLGALEFGMEFGGDFIERLKAKYYGDYYLFVFDSSKQPVIVAGTRPSDRCPLAERHLDVLQRGDPVWSLDCSNARAVGLYPFKDFSGKAIGFIKAELLRIPLSDAVADVQRRLVILGTILLVSLAVFLFVSMRFLLQPLRAVVSQTKIISQKILAGDMSYRGNIAETAPDFKEIIGEVNNIINALRERGTLLRAIVEGIPGIVYYVGSDYRVLWANSLALDHVPGLLGMDLGKESTGFFEHESELLREAFSRGSIASFDACYIKEPNCQECWEHVAVPVRSSDGGTDHVIRISRDITDKRRVESELRLLNETLERRVEEEVRRRKEGEIKANQQSRLAAVGELATGMAHEITQPLNAISFTIGNLRARFASGILDVSYLNGKAAAIDSDIDRVRRVIDHVRLFARGTPEGYRVAFSVNRCVENTMTIMGVQLSTHGIEAVFQPGEFLPDLHGNPFQYEQVVLNLLSNARDAIEERLINDAEANARDSIPGRIHVKTTFIDGRVELTVEDNGIGLPSGQDDRVFDPFFTTKDPGKGTGLGLSISYGIVREMRGSIVLERKPLGTISRVSVPVESFNEGRL
jgi:signal transduction histidine kinase